MNKIHFRENSLGRLFRLRPLPYRINLAGKWLETLDDQWHCERIEGDFVKLSNLRTGHFVDLGFDHIREYLSPDMLILKSQITLRGPNLYVEPLLVR